MRVRLVQSVGDVEPEAWDALAGDDDPFVEHAFLSVLEDSGSVGGRSGWDPTHVTVWDGARLVGALPLYVKEHSFGEYIFDWGWADAAARLGVDYYPKLVSMVPVTPVTGRRLLVAPDADRFRVVAEIVRGCFEAADALRASSLHVNFLTEAEREDLAIHGRLMPRLSHQFHWTNEGWGCFDDYLAAFRSSQRKQVRRERRRVVEAGIDVSVRTGDAIATEDWDRAAFFYRVTCARYGSHAYLTPEFFELAAARLGHRAVIVRADKGGETVAATLNFEKGAHLYGRYWGSLEDYDALHFELCYYQLIERAIALGMRRFEAGAQGTHKLRRGLMPRRIWSAHWIRHPLLSAAVADFLPREAMSVQHRIAELAEHGPFRRG